ncbi:hypothetical protein OG205_16845 [Lentzea sp. NBC_00516]|uniref:hypothetical protein n=1 Tax=Lentzea sp. NBC_00516 TaxID=2903582 RepID=UPI002E806C84|nr:hypothetical protein [Lentzea sp. NBC_00516]WUD28604.1 hypothetical protein OG205_16845 [Lentzea sp. NBC_00516]
MDRKIAWLAGAVTAVAVSAGTLALTAGPAAAAGCSAPAGKSCVAVRYEVAHVKSVRVNGRCLIGGSGQHPGVIIDQLGWPDVQTYGGTRCEGHTHNSAIVHPGKEDRHGYRWITISDYEN